MFRYDKYVWYYEYIEDTDKDVKNKLLNQFEVIRLEAWIYEDFKIIHKLEQNYYDYKRKYFKLFLFNIFV